MIVINLSQHVVNHDGKQIIPGTNVVDSFESKHPVIADMVENGELKIISEISKASKSDKAEAIRHCATKAILDAVTGLVNASKDSNLSKTAKKQGEELDAFDREIEEAKKKKEDEE